MILKLFFATALLTISLDSFSQSKSETIKWLNAKFQNVSTYDVAGGSDIKYLKRFLKINSDGSYVIISKYYKELDEKPVETSTESGHFKDLNPETVTLSKGVGYSFNVICTNSKKCVTSKYMDKSGTLKTSSDSSIEFGAIDIDNDPDLENRIVTALKHLIELFGGKKDTF